MILTVEERERLDNLFDGLWGCRGGVKGSWGASSFRYHPAYIRRGPLLLHGEGECSAMEVLIPGDCQVDPCYGDSRASCNVSPVIHGKAVRVSFSDDGPWWDLLREELPKMEAELRETNRRRAEAEEEKKRELAARREAELAEALNAVNSMPRV